MCSLAVVARQQIGNQVPSATNIRNNRIIVKSICLWVSLCIPLSLLGNNSVKTFPWPRRIAGGVVFYADCVASKDLPEFIVHAMSVENGVLLISSIMI
jgi:hypothetical protein